MQLVTFAFFGSLLLATAVGVGLNLRGRRVRHRATATRAANQRTTEALSQLARRLDQPAPAREVRVALPAPTVPAADAAESEAQRVERLVAGAQAVRASRAAIARAEARTDAVLTS